MQSTGNLMKSEPEMPRIPIFSSPMASASWRSSRRTLQTTVPVDPSGIGALLDVQQVKNFFHAVVPVLSTSMHVIMSYHDFIALLSPSGWLVISAP